MSAEPRSALLMLSQDMHARLKRLERQFDNLEDGPLPSAPQATKRPESSGKVVRLDDYRPDGWPS